MADQGNAERTSSLRAVAHPLRLQILSLLTGTEMSAAEVARELGVTHANASYHLRVLADAGELVVAGEEKIRGGVAKRYRHPWDKGLAGGQRPGWGGPEDFGLYVRAMADELVRRAALRERGQASWLTDAELWVEPEAWRRAAELVMEASRLVHDRARPPHTAGTVHVNLSAALFRMTEPTEKEADR
jgi:DNA-binding transcriptional ArsR family regulator